MELETPRLILRTFAEYDLEAMAHRLLGDPQVMRYIPQSSLEPLERARRHLNFISRHWQEHGYGLWAITLKPGGELIGQGGLNRLPELDENEVDYMLALAHWGRGYATEAARACLWFGFEQLGLERVIGLVVPDNQASSHVLEKLGMGYKEMLHLWGLDLARYTIERPAYLQGLIDEQAGIYRIHGQ